MNSITTIIQRVTFTGRTAHLMGGCLVLLACLVGGCQDGKTWDGLSFSSTSQPDDMPYLEVSGLHTTGQAVKTAGTGRKVLPVPVEFTKPKPQAKPIRTVVLGKSVRGEDLTMHVFGKGETTVFIFGGIHGEEGASAVVAANLVEYLKKHPSRYHGRTVAILPRANPDGLRANRRVNEHGVDLNRNFPARNFKVSARYGRRPASEPETRAIIKAMKTLKPDRVVSIHTCRKGRHGNNFDGPADRMARTMSLYNRYRSFGDWHNPTPGSFGTWAGKEQKIPVVTLEIPNHLAGRQAWEANRDALLSVIDME